MEVRLPSQPPPDAPAPPPGPEARRSREKMVLIFVIGPISMLLLFGLSAPIFLKSRKAVRRTQAVSHIKQINLALFDFDADYGRFPDAATIADVRSKTRTTLLLGTSTSNDHFRQLIAAGMAAETIFWAEIPATPRRPDGILGADALKKGECSFAYVAGLCTSDALDTPVVMTPMVPGTLRFDSTARDFGDKAVVLRIDGSAKAEAIKTSTGEVLMPGGKTLFDPTSPHWHGKAPNLKLPE